MNVTLVGVGAGGGTLTLEALRALEAAQVLIGAPRLIDALPEGFERTRCIPEISSERIIDRIDDERWERVCVLLSGDSGFYSAARSLIGPLRERGFEVDVLPGLSCVSLLAARLGRPWQEWTLASAHGASIDVLDALKANRPALILTDCVSTPQALCAELTAAGLGELGCTVGENLGTADESIRTSCAREFADETFASLSVLLIEAAGAAPRRVSGWPDEVFLRGQVPMTKQAVRAMVLGLLEVGPEDICWDIGAGTGSVSVEMAALAAQVFAVETNPEAARLVRANRERFCTWNLRVIEGHAPEALGGLPQPDKVFIGGTKGSLRPILDVVFEEEPPHIVCVSAITVETLAEAVAFFRERGVEPEVHSLAVSSSRSAGDSTMMIANNPVSLIVGRFQ